MESCVHESCAEPAAAGADFNEGGLRRIRSICRVCKRRLRCDCGRCDGINQNSLRLTLHALETKCLGLFNKICATELFH